MSKRFLTPVLLPADPANPLEAATKQYVDGKAGSDEIHTGATPPADLTMLWADTTVTSVGSGVPPGGALNQVLTKISATDYDMGWAAATGGLDQATADTLYLSRSGDSVPTADYEVRSIASYDATVDSFLSRMGCNSIFVNTLLQVYTPIYLDGTANVPTDPRHATSKSYVDGLASQATLDARYVNVTTDTMLGSLHFDSGGTTQGSLSTTSAALRIFARLGGRLELGTTNGPEMKIEGGVGVTMLNTLLLNGAPLLPLEAATKGYVDGLASQATLDARYVNVTGDTVSGNLIVNAQLLFDTNAASIDADPGLLNISVPGVGGTARVIVNGSSRFAVSDTDIIVYPGVATALRVTTVTGTLTLSADPTLALQAATKQYVDAQRDTRQPLDSDLTTIASLSAASGNIIQSVGGTWAVQTPTQVKTSMSLTKTDVGLANVDNTSDANKPVSTAQAAADALRVLKAGDTMTGPLIISGPPWDHIIIRGASQADYRWQSTTPTDWALATGSAAGLGFTTFVASSNIRFSPDNTQMLTLGKTLISSSVPIQLPADPASALHAATKQYVDGLASTTLDARYINVTGDTMTGPLVLSADPAAALGAATKQYVDARNPFTTWSGTQAQFDAIPTLDANTFYYVTP